MNQFVMTPSANFTLRTTLCIAAFLLNNMAWGQATNVIGAKSERYSEVEVDEQSAFVDANQKYLLGDYAKAKELTEKIVYDHENNDGAHFLMSRINLALKDYNAALISVSKAIKLDPDNRWYYHLQADIYEATSRVPDAVEVYERLLARTSPNPSYFEKLCYLNTLAGEPEKALAVLDRWQKYSGINEEIASRRHLLAIGMKNDKAAIKALIDLTEAFPSNTDFKHKLARYYRETNRSDEAIGVYQQILKLNPDDPDARIGVIGKTTATNEQDFLAQLRPLLADPTIAIDSKITKLMPFLTKMEQETDSTKRAAMQQAAKDLTVTHPNEAKAWSFAGDVHYLLNENAEALALYRKCISLQPEVFSVWQNTYEILNAQENYKDLMIITEKGMDAFPNQALSYYFYGVAANQLDKPNEALPQLRQALLMSGNQLGLKFDIQSAMGVSNIKSGKAQAAIELLEPLLAKGGTKHAGLLETLGDAYSAKGDKSKAMQFWQDAAKLVPNKVSLSKKLGI
jgi:tetratricopeptide (TPR) repeat protein